MKWLELIKRSAPLKESGNPDKTIEQLREAILLKTTASASSATFTVPNDKMFYVESWAVVTGQLSGTSAPQFFNGSSRDQGYDPAVKKPHRQEYGFIFKSAVFSTVTATEYCELLLVGFWIDIKQLKG